MYYHVNLALVRIEAGSFFIISIHVTYEMKSVPGRCSTRWKDLTARMELI
jgi:hypothetical protein